MTPFPVLAAFALFVSTVSARPSDASRTLLHTAGIESAIESVLQQPASPQMQGFGGDVYNVSREVPDTAPVLGVDTSQLNPAPQCEAAIAVTLTKLPDTSSGGTLYSAALDFYLRNWAGNTIAAPWSVSMFNPVFLSVQNITGVYLTSPKRVQSGYIEGTANKPEMALLPLGTSTTNFSATIIVSSGNGLPRSLSINYTPCVLVTVSGVGDTKNPAPPAPPPSPLDGTLPPPSPPPPESLTESYPDGAVQRFRFEKAPRNKQPLSIQDNQFIGVDGKPVQLRGINWFGYEDGNTAPDGIWFGPSTLTRDVATITKRIKALGFNAVRMPFSMKDLWGLRPRMFNWQCEVASAQAFLKSVTDPLVKYPSSFPIDFELPYDVPSSPGSCGDYLPQNSVFNRFIWQIGFLARNGFYVLIDNHLQFDTTVYDDNTAWLLGWKRVMSTIALDPVAVNMVMYDILNEPDSKGIGWEGSGSGRSMTDNYLAVMNQGYQINPDAVYFIEGTGQNSINANWGDGFSTSPSIIKKGGASDPTRFFKTLLKKPYRGNVVISPHIYPPSVTFAVVATSGSDLYDRLSVAHGYLSKKGFCDGDDCQKFMIVPGEFGSKMLPDQKKDLTFLADLGKYWRSPGKYTDILHRSVENWFWWCWNVNSIDTGGMVGEDWLTIQWNKIRFLKTLGLQPWYTSFERQTQARRAKTEDGGPTDIVPCDEDSKPSDAPTAAPNRSPIPGPTSSPTPAPSSSPTPSPTKPTPAPTSNPTPSPTKSPTPAPTSNPTPSPTKNPTPAPTSYPTPNPTKPTPAPTSSPTPSPTKPPSAAPTASPTNDKRVVQPTSAPTGAPAAKTTGSPTAAPSQASPAPTKSATVASGGSQAAYTQCGGNSRPSSSNVANIGDFRWADFGGPACVSGNDCKRQSEWYWQCLPQ